MIKDLHFPEQCTGQLLDKYLRHGWYRLGQIIFTTDFIPHAESWYRVFWLRYNLDAISYSKKQLAVLKLNQHFTVRIKPLKITKEIENLYQRYKSHIDFEISPTLKNYLYDGSTFDAPKQNVFHTEMIEVRDNNRLIAAGIYDNGEDSIAGIINFYHPDYARFSLGKFLMLSKINHAIATNKTWYYPGYIAYLYTKFDYKLFPSRKASEIYDPETQNWLPYSEALMAELAGRQ
jgi:leucyl-tRNA---protein transferase